MYKKIGTRIYARIKTKSIHIYLKQSLSATNFFYSAIVSSAFK